MKDMMQDLETLGQTPGCIPLSFGGVMMGPKGLGNELYVVFNTADCEKAGLFKEQSTLNWWAEQSSEAREVMKLAANKKTSVPLKTGLTQIAEFVTANGARGLRVHGNGSDFDNAILAVAFYKAGMKLPWEFWNNRCHRTNKAKMKGLEPKRQGTYHNALDDAKHQARHAIALAKAGIPIFV
jgi:hypothetical protein